MDKDVIFKSLSILEDALDEADELYGLAGTNLTECYETIYQYFFDLFYTQ